MKIMSDQVSEVDIERRLNSTFKLVEPDPEFINRLRQKLIWQPESIVVEQIQPKREKLFAGLLMLAILAIVTWFVRRAYRLKP